MEENNLTKQNVIDIILNNLENDGPLKDYFEKRFFSNYRPWQAVFLRGTKT